MTWKMGRVPTRSSRHGHGRQFVCSSFCPVAGSSVGPAQAAQVAGHCGGDAVRGDCGRGRVDGGGRVRAAQAGLVEDVFGVAQRDSVSRYVWAGVQPAGPQGVSGVLCELGQGGQPRAFGRGGHRWQDRAAFARRGFGQRGHSFGQRLGQCQPSGIGPSEGGREIQRDPNCCASCRSKAAW